MITAFSERATDRLDMRQMSPVCKLAKAVHSGGPYSPLQSAMMALFMAVMGFYAAPEHHCLRIPEGLIKVMISLRGTVAQQSSARQRSILAAAADYTAYSPATASRDVQRAIDAAHAALRASWEAERLAKKDEGSR
jgi:hypothetical protein